MKALVQRVSEASVKVQGKAVASIGRGLLVLVGFHQSDEPRLCERLLDKLMKLRIFEDAAGKMNHSVRECGGSILLVPQFTLYGDCQKGNRPSFVEAARPEQGRELFDYLASLAQATDIPVASGIFQATMQVHLVNEGPVTLILELP